VTATLRSTWIRFWLWVGFIVLAVTPWEDLQNHSHWRRVQWIPFVTPPVKPIDIVVNVLLYLPFGYWFAQLRGGRRGQVWGAVVAAAMLSLATEWTQLYSHSRFPSMTDVTNNLIGTALGAWWVSAGVASAFRRTVSDAGRSVRL